MEQGLSAEQRFPKDTLQVSHSALPPYPPPLSAISLRTRNCHYAL